MQKTNKEQYTLIAFSLFPCIVWALVTLGSIIFRHHINYPKLLCYTAYRALYLLCALVFLFALKYSYKKWLHNVYDAHEKEYLIYNLLAIISIVCGFFVRTKFWNYILDGCFISPFIEELIARFMLYEARHHSWKLYALGALLSSLTFSLMHIGYDPSLLKNSTIFSKLNEHFLFGLILCSVFWFFPKLSLLISIHAISNLYGILKIASKLGYPL